MSIKSLLLFLTTYFFAFGILGNSVFSQQENVAGHSLFIENNKDQRMEWWREARFGMFIHWGLYAIPAGEWKGKEIDWDGAWIMNRAKIPVDEYTPLSKQFDPVNYDPAEWVRTAKDAGMKYIVITAKHHDGFCLFATDATKWDVVDSTPYGKDLLVPLAEECRKQGIKFCTYYSILDWHHPSQRIVEEDRVKTKIEPDRKDEYVHYMKTQLLELIETCDPEVLWFDGQWVDWWTKEDGEDLHAYLMGLKPTLIINNRIGKEEYLTKDNTSEIELGDFGTPEQEIPETGVPGLDWESCLTMNGTWGYKKNDTYWKSEQDLIRSLIEISSKGGNLLLNVGPKSNGEIPSASLVRLENMGRWMKQNGEAIYGTQASPMEAASWGRYTSKRVSGKDMLYAHVIDPPQDLKIRIPWSRQSMPECFLIDNGSPLQVKQDGNEIIISLPSQMSSNDIVVIRIEANTGDIADIN